MSIDKIEARIMTTAKMEAGAIISEAEDGARDRLEHHKSHEQHRFEKAAAAETARLRQLHESEVSSAKAANKLELLKLRAEIIEDVFAKAVEKFLANRGGDYEKWLASQLNSVEAQKGEIFAAPADKAKIAQLLADMKNSGRAKNLTLAAQPENKISGGIILRGERIDLDLSFDMKLSSLKEKLVPELAQMAFGGNE